MLLYSAGNIYKAGLIFNKNQPTLLHTMFYRLLIPWITARATVTASVSGNQRAAALPCQPLERQRLEASSISAHCSPERGGRTCFTYTVLGCQKTDEVL